MGAAYRNGPLVPVSWVRGPKRRCSAIAERQRPGAGVARHIRCAPAEDADQRRLEGLARAGDKDGAPTPLRSGSGQGRCSDEPRVNSLKSRRSRSHGSEAIRLSGSVCVSTLQVVFWACIWASRRVWGELLGVVGDIIGYNGAKACLAEIQSIENLVRWISTALA